MNVPQHRSRHRHNSSSMENHIAIGYRTMDRGSVAHVAKDLFNARLFVHRMLRRWRQRQCLDACPERQQLLNNVKTEKTAAARDADALAGPEAGVGLHFCSWRL